MHVVRKNVSNASIKCSLFRVDRWFCVLLFFPHLSSSRTSEPLQRIKYERRTNVQQKICKSIILYVNAFLFCFFFFLCHHLFSKLQVYNWSSSYNLIMLMMQRLLAVVFCFDSSFLHCIYTPSTT